MTVPKTALVAVALLLAAAAAQLASTGPYDYFPWSTVYYYLLWFPPHAVPMNLTLLNVTWSKPEAIWFKSTYYVEVCNYSSGFCNYGPATIYVVQDGVRVRKDVRTASYHIVAGFVEWHVNRICAQGIAMVAPNKIIVLNATTQIWISDVYCLYRNRWFWLRLLPYNLKDELEVEGIELVDAGIDVDIPSNYPWPLIPAAWYLDPWTKRVFRIPNDTAVMAELQRLRMRVYELETELANKTALLNATAAQLNMTVTQLSLTIAKLNTSLAEAREEAARLAAENQRLRAQLEALNHTRVQLEAELSACKSQVSVLRSANANLTATLARLETENQALKAQIVSMNKTLAELNEAYVSQTAQLETWTRVAWIGAALGAAAGAAVTALALRRRK
jgi:regulator of replication initiation timing